MGCACKVNRHIESIHRNYGENVGHKKSSMRFNAKLFIQKLFLLIFVMIPLCPIILVYVLYQYYYKNNNKISISKFLNLKKNEQKYI